MTPSSQLKSRGIFSFPFARAHELQPFDGYVLLLDRFLERTRTKQVMLEACFRQRFTVLRNKSFGSKHHLEIAAPGLPRVGS